MKLTDLLTKKPRIPDPALESVWVDPATAYTYVYGQAEGKPGYFESFDAPGETQCIRWEPEKYPDNFPLRPQGDPAPETELERLMSWASKLGVPEQLMKTWEAQGIEELTWYHIAEANQYLAHCEAEMQIEEAEKKEAEAPPEPPPSKTTKLSALANIDIAKFALPEQLEAQRQRLLGAGVAEDKADIYMKTWLTKAGYHPKAKLTQGVIQIVTSGVNSCLSPATVVKEAQKTIKDADAQQMVTGMADSLPQRIPAFDEAGALYHLKRVRAIQNAISDVAHGAAQLMRPLFADLRMLSFCGGDALKEYAATQLPRKKDGTVKAKNWPTLHGRVFFRKSGGPRMSDSAEFKSWLKNHPEFWDDFGAKEVTDVTYDWRKVYACVEAGMVVPGFSMVPVDEFGKVSIGSDKPWTMQAVKEVLKHATAIDVEPGIPVDDSEESEEGEE